MSSLEVSVLELLLIFMLCNSFLNAAIALYCPVGILRKEDFKKHWLGHSFLVLWFTFGVTILNFVACFGKLLQEHGEYERGKL